MKQSLTIAQLADQVHSRAARKKDFLVPTTETRFYPTESGVRLDFRNNSTGGPLLITPSAHKQVAARLDIPLKYYERMQKEKPELLCANVNTWFQHTPEERMIRTLDDTMRAFLSNRYRRLDDEDLMQALMPTLMDVPDMKIESCAVTEQRMYIKALFPRITGEVKKGQVVQFGVIISNSEIGWGAIEVSPMVMVLACLNGMVVPDSRVRRNHVGRAAASSEEAYELYSDDTLKADDMTVFMKMRDLLKAILQSATSNKILARLQAAAGDRIVGSPIKAAEELAKANLFSEDESKKFFDLFSREADYTKWGLAQAVTAMSQRVESYDRATELERLGGKIIDLPISDWNVLREAA